MSDLSNVLNYRPSADEAAGRQPLPAEGPWPGCVITKLEAHAPNEKYSKGEVARLEFHFQCDERGEELVKFINFKPPLHKRSTMYKLMRAIFGDDMDQHSIEELQGQTVDITIFHEEMDDGTPYADYKFTNAG